MFDAKELSKLAASPRLRTLRLREGRHAGYGGEGGMQPMLVTHTLRLVLLTTVPLDNAMLIPVLRVPLPLLPTTHLFFCAAKMPSASHVFPHIAFCYSWRPVDTTTTLRSFMVR